MDRSLVVYSGHDVTLVSLWRALGRRELLEPEYGASLVLELHEDVEQEAFFVKVSISPSPNTSVDGFIRSNYLSLQFMSSKVLIRHIPLLIKWQ